MSERIPTGDFDFWYAVNNTEIPLMPVRRLETFGSTIIYYHMLSEPMDAVRQTRIREGRIQAYQPQILTPASFANAILEGFGPEAEAYVQWLREHTQDLHILRYGFHIRKEEIQEHLVHETLETIKPQIVEQARKSPHPMTAVVAGVDHPWEVSLIKLMADVIRYSAPGNVRDLARRKLLEDDGGLPRAVREELDSDFFAAARNPRLIKPLARKLQQYGVFEEYQDRFFSLVRSNPEAAGETP